MRKILVKNCRYATSPISGQPCFTDVYVLLNEDGQMLWHENLFLAEMSISCSLNTIRSLANDLLSFVKMAYPLGGWSKITKSQMLGYLHAELFQRRQYRKSSMMRHVDSLKKFYFWLEKKGYIDILPDFDWAYSHLYSRSSSDKTAYLLRHHSFHSLYIDREVYLKLLSSVSSQNAFIKARDRIVLQFGYECGIRAEEALDLNVMQVRAAINYSKKMNNGLWATSIVTISGKGARKRELLLPPELSEKVMDYLTNFRDKLNNGEGALFCSMNGKNITDPKFASRVFCSAFRKAKLTRTNRQGFHRLRKSFGTNLVQDCYDNHTDPWVEVPRRLGHQNFQTTLQYIQFDALRHNRSRVLSELAMASEKYKSIHLRSDASNDLYR